MLVLSDGNNILPEELEVLLEKLPLVESVFVCGQMHNGLTMVTACIHPDYVYAREAGITQIQAELERETAQINTELPLYKRIQRIVISEDEFEKTALGKIKRHKHKTDS